MSQGIMNIQIGMLDICNLLALPRNEKHKCIYIAKQSLFAISSNIMGTALLMRKNNWNSMLHDKVGLGIARTTCLSPSFWKL